MCDMEKCGGVNGGVGWVERRCVDWIVMCDVEKYANVRSVIHHRTHKMYTLQHNNTLHHVNTYHQIKVISIHNKIKKSILLKEG
jgi:hypothetical protein